MKFAMLIEVRCYPPLIKGYLMLIFRSGKLPYLLVPSNHWFEYQNEVRTKVILITFDTSLEVALSGPTHTQCYSITTTAAADRYVRVVEKIKLWKTTNEKTYTEVVWCKDFLDEILFLQHTCARKTRLWLSKGGKLPDIEFIFISKVIYIFPNWFNNN